VVELEPSRWQIVASFFSQQLHQLPARSVLEGKYPGKVMVDNVEAPTVALVWALGRWSYLAGSVTDGLSSSLRAAVNDILVPVQKELEREWVEIYAPDVDHWDETVRESLVDYQSERHMESTYRWNEEKYRAFRRDYSLPEGIRNELVDVPILERYCQTSPIISEGFRIMTAVGCRISRDGESLAQCENNGFESDRQFTIHVVTFDETQRGKGLATAASVGLLDHCLDSGLTPVWETTEYNEPSHRLALRLGFEPVEAYPVYALWW